MRSTTAVLLWLAASAFTQQQTAPPPLTEHIEVNVVNVDVTVLDSRGNPVSDLTKDDFELREDGVPQQITNFAVEKSEKAVPKAQAPDAAFASDPDHRRTVIALIDVRAFGEKPQRARAVEALQKMLADYPADTNWSVVILRNGLRSMQTLLPITTNRAAIGEAFKALRDGVSLPSSTDAAIQRIRAVGAVGNGDIVSGIDAAQTMEQAVSFFSAVIQAARGVAWLPGKKLLLIVSSSVPGYVRAGTPNSEGLAELHAKMVEEVNGANASIYVVDPLGVSAELDMSRGDFWGKAANLRTDAGQRGVGGAVWLSEMTGGLYLPSNDMQQSVGMVQRATTNYYELAYHTPAADNKYHAITVTLKRPGRYTVTNRQGYVRLSKEEGFTRAMTTPLGIASQRPTLPVELTIAQPKQLAGGDFSVPFRAAVPVKVLQTIPDAGSRTARAHVYISAFDKDGRLVQFSHFVETLKNVSNGDSRTLAIERSVALQKGVSRLFVTFRDELTDEVGIATKDINL